MMGQTFLSPIHAILLSPVSLSAFSCIHFLSSEKESVMLLRRTSQREADVLSSSSPAEKSKGKELESRGRRVEREKNI